MSARSLRVPVWILVALGATLAAFFFAGGGMPLRRSLLTCYTWALLIWPIVWLDRRLPIPRDALARRAAVHVPLSIAWTIVFLAAISWVGEPILRSTITPEMSSPGVWERVRTGGLQWNAMYYWVLVGGFYAIDYHRESSERQRRAAELERLLTEAQLTALRAQLHPHFLFNALNTISAEVERQPKVARRMLEHLGELLRLSLERAQPDKVPLTDELEMLEHYLAIQRARYAGRLDIQMAIDPAARDALVPGLLLQPLVENAIRHGLAPRVQPGRLRVSARVQHDRLQLTVQDDGVGLPGGWTLDRHAGIGLSTTRRRLETLYGAGATFDVRPTAATAVALGAGPGAGPVAGPAPAGGVTVDVSLPLERTVVAAAPGAAVVPPARGAIAQES